MRKLVSTRLPSTLPASAALARPAPIEAASSCTVTGATNSRRLPSGSVIVIMGAIFGMPETRKAPKGACIEPATWERSAVGVGSVHVARSAGVAAGHLWQFVRGMRSTLSQRGGRYRVRTCDPYHVKVVLYR